MLISVITASYNSECSIRATIESVIQQNFDLEHIIVDGASSDKTVEILSEYKHLKWISEADAGVYDAMNKGVQMASGDWIYFLGSDDELVPGILSTLEKDFLNSELDLVYGQVWVRKSGMPYGGEFPLERFLINNICQQAIFYRRELFNSTVFDHAYPIAADYVFNIPLFIREDIKTTFRDLVIAYYDGNGLSERVIDRNFLKNKISLFSRALGKSRFNPFFDNFRHQEAINQILYGDVLLGWVEMLLHIIRRGGLFRNIRTAAAMTKERLIGRGK